MCIELSVVIPAFNEEENVDLLYGELKEVLLLTGKSYEIIFVDDGSLDSTYQKLKGIQEYDATIKILKLRKNFGQSPALKAGFDYAGGNIIITLDADRQNDPHDIIFLLEKLQNDDLDVVCGWRFDRKDPFIKQIFSKYANRLRRAFTGEAIHDSGCTLRVYKKECVSDIELWGELHRYIPVMLLWRGFKIGELTVHHRERECGVSKYNWSRIVKGFLDLFIVTFWQKYSLRPIHLFGGLGLVVGFTGFLITCYLVVDRLLFGHGLTERPLFLVGIFFIMIGVQFFVFGIMADILLKVYYGQNDRKPYLIEKVIG